MDFENILNASYCHPKDAVSKYQAFRNKKVIITTEIVKNLYYYTDLFYKILVFSQYKNHSDEKAFRDMAIGLCYVVDHTAKFSIFNHIKSYRLIKYIYKKHKDFIEPYLDSNKAMLNAF
jgi:hypothetical protein